MKTTFFPQTTKWLCVAAMTLSVQAAFAGAPVIDAAAQQLQIERMKAEDQNAHTVQTLTEIEAQKAELERKKREIEESNKHTLDSVKKPLTPELREAVMSMNIPNCKVTKKAKESPAEHQEYYIEGRDRNGDKLIIRFLFSENLLNDPSQLLSDRAAYMKPAAVQPDGTHPVQFEQPRFSLKDATKDGPFFATVVVNPRYDANGKIVAYDVVKAVFGGEAVSDQNLGFSSSFAPSILSCLL
jgi:hypothetical protein